MSDAFQKGFIKDYRVELESDIWLMPPIYHRIWQWIKYRANHTEREIPLSDGSHMLIKKGQFLTSLRKIAQGVGWYERRSFKEPNVKTVKAVLTWLEKNEMIKVDNGNRKYTLVTIEKWDFYQCQESRSGTESIQSLEQSGNSEGTVREQLLDTNKNVKNEKNLKNENNGKNSLVETPLESNEKKKRKKRIYDEDDIYYKSALSIREKVLSANPNFRVPKIDIDSMHNWSDDCRKIIEIDKRENVKEVVSFVFNSGFWDTIIQSPGGLRKNWDSILGSMQRSKNTKIRNIGYGNKTSDAVMKKIQEEGEKEWQDPFACFKEE